MNDQKPKDFVSPVFKKRFARRATTYRPFTFVRNFESQAESHEQIVKEVGERGVVITSPLHLQPADSGTSITDIVQQSPVPVVIAHAAPESSFEQNDEGADVEEDDEDLSLTVRRTRRSREPSVSFLSRRQYPSGSGQLPRSHRVPSEHYIGSKTNSNIDDEVSFVDDDDGQQPSKKNTSASARSGKSSRRKPATEKSITMEKTGSGKKRNKKGALSSSVSESREVLSAQDSDISQPLTDSSRRQPGGKRKKDGVPDLGVSQNSSSISEGTSARKKTKQNIRLTEAQKNSPTVNDPPLAQTTVDHNCSGTPKEIGRRGKGRDRLRKSPGARPTPAVSANSGNEMARGNSRRISSLQRLGEEAQSLSVGKSRAQRSSKRKDRTIETDSLSTDPGTSGGESRTADVVSDPPASKRKARAANVTTDLQTSGRKTRTANVTTGQQMSGRKSREEDVGSVTPSSMTESETASQTTVSLPDTVCDKSGVNRQKRARKKPDTSDHHDQNRPTTEELSAPAQSSRPVGQSVTKRGLSEKTDKEANQMMLREKKTRNNKAKEMLRQTDRHGHSEGQEQSATLVPPSPPTTYVSTKDSAGFRSQLPLSRLSIVPTEQGTGDDQPSQKGRTTPRISENNTENRGSPKRFFTNLERRTPQKLTAQRKVAIRRAPKKGTPQASNSFWKRARKVIEKNRGQQQLNVSSGSVYDDETFGEAFENGTVLSPVKKRGGWSRVQQQLQERTAAAQMEEEVKKRKNRGVTELDVITEMMEETEASIMEDYNMNKVCKSAVRKEFTFVRKQLKQTMLQVNEIKELTSSINKLRGDLRVLNTASRENHKRKCLLRRELLVLKRQGVDVDTLHISAWLQDFTAFRKRCSGPAS